MERVRAKTRIARGRYKCWTQRLASICLCILAFVAIDGSPVSAQTPNSQLRSPGTITTPLPEPSPTPDTERILLEKEKLRIDNENNKRDLSARSILNLIYGNLSVLLALMLALGGLIKYFKEQKTIRRKREEERFENIVKSLGGEHEQERISAAVLLPTFLSTEYSRFHEQVFNLAAGHLRMGRAEPDGTPIMKVELPGNVNSVEMRFHKEPLEYSSEDSPAMPVREQRELLPLPHPLTQTLANVLCDSYRIIRDTLKLASKDVESQIARRRHLNAFGVRMEAVELSGVDLEWGQLKQSSLRQATLEGAYLANIMLASADLSGANLIRADLRDATLTRADFTDAVLTSAALDRANVVETNFRNAKLAKVTMYGTTAWGAQFDGADLSGARLFNVKFGAREDEDGGKLANPEAATTLRKAIFQDVTGLTDVQRSLCIEKGAIFQNAEPSITL
jgi:uncharacterized protein YjbI with pentapeptide repeats